MQNPTPTSDMLQQLDKLHLQFIKFSQLEGCLNTFKNPDTKTRYINHMPLAALPYSIQRSKYQALKESQPIWCKLFVKLAADKDFINKTLALAVKHDFFVNQILRIYNEVQNPQKIEMNILRSDYMLDEASDRFLMVEWNLMAVSMVYINDGIQEVQKNILTNYFPEKYQAERFVKSHNADTICDMLIEAIKLSDVKGKIVMVVQEEETNVFDQGLIEQGILRRGNQIVRATFKDLFERLSLDESSLDITYSGQPIALFYFRDGYVPANYTTPNSWKVRQTIERSRAVKIPTIAMQLVNTKRIQQQLYSKEVLSKYLPEEEYLKIYNEMAAMHNFQSKETFEKTMRSMDPEKIILKPNRDGGNNNFFGEQAIAHLEGLNEEERQQYILMEKICPSPVFNIFFKQGVGAIEEKTVSEVSVNSAFIYKQNQIIKEQFSGSLVRTKNNATKEGGICAQASVLSGMYLVDK